MTLLYIILIVVAVGVLVFLFSRKKGGPSLPMKPQGPSAPPSTPPSPPPPPPPPSETPGM